MFNRRRHRSITFFLLTSLVAGCGGATVSPIFPTSETLARPDRVIVYDFAVVPDEFEISSRGAGLPPPRDVQVGKAFATALTDRLIEELRSRGIDSQRASDAAPPGDSTASIKGRFLRPNDRDRTMMTGFGIGDGQVRTKVQIMQGSGLRLGVVAESETSTKSNLRSLSGPIPAGIIEGEAKQIAAEVADRIIAYYKRRGWLN